jgi:hypothetical protein
MIIQENNTNVPDQNPTGGVITFAFDFPVDVVSIDVLNLANSNNTLIISCSPMRTRAVNITAPTTGANGFAKVWIEVQNVTKERLLM